MKDRIHFKSYRV